MSVRTDVINLNVNVNGNAARAELNNLRKRAADVSLEMEGLGKRTKAYAEKKKELAGITGEMDKLRKQIGITGLTQKELTAELAKLKAMRGSVTPFSDEYKQLSREIERVEKRLYDVRKGVTGVGSMFSKVGDQVKQFGVLAAGYLGFQFITSQFQNIIRGGGKLSDSLADIRRVTGLTADEVDHLNEQLKGLDTRTSSEGLRNIVVIAGKLGVAKDQLISFTRAVDMLVVALGDELGDASNITTELGKILNVFDGGVTGDNITKLGNAIVDLANKGVASGGFIVDFTQRMAGLAGTANLTLDASVGLAAGLEEIGQRSESSSTAVINLLGLLGKDVKVFAKAAGKDVQEFAKTVRDRPVEALLQLAEAVTKNKSGLQELSPVFQQLGVDGVRAQTVLGAIGNKTDFFRQKIKDAGSALQQTSEITDAFALKNETFGAVLDKIGKKVNSWVMNGPLMNFLKEAAIGFGRLIGAIEKSGTAMDEYKKKQDTFNKLEKDLLPLINRMEELKRKAVELGDKSKLSREEQEELDRAVQAIAGTIPYAVTEFDKYGRALDVNTGKARQFIEMQRSVLRIKNAEEIKSTETTIGEIKKQIDYNEKWSQSVKKKGEEDAKRWGKNAEDRMRIETTISKMSQGIATRNIALNQKLIDQQNYLLFLKGQTPGDNNPPPATTTTTTTTTTPPIVIDPDDEQKKKLEQLRKEAAEFKREIDQLRRQIEIDGMTADEAEIARIEDKYAELVERAKKYNFELLTIEGVKEKELQQLYDRRFKKQFEEGAAKEYEASLQASQDYFNEERRLAAEHFASGALDKKQYEERLRRIERDEVSDRIIIAQDYSQTVKKAAEDVKNFKKQQEQQTTQDLIEEGNKRIAAEENEARERMAKARRKVLTSRGDERVQAQKDELQLQFDLETEFLDKKSELYLLKETELQQAMADVDKDAQMEKINRVMEYVGFFQNAMTSLHQFISNREARMLNEEKKRADSKKKELKKQLDDKLISQSQYELKVAEVEEEHDKKSAEIKRRQAKREKALNIFNALINTAASVIKMLADPGGVAGVALSIAAGITGALQVAAIASAPLPELGLGDWIRKGPKHRDKEKGIPVMIERDEAVMSAAAMTDPDVYTVTGTTAQITSALNSKKGGTSWAGGALMQVASWQTEKPAQINPGMPRIMEQGGIVRPLDPEAAGGTSLATDLLQVLIQKQEENTEEIKTMKTRLHAVVSIKEYRETEALYDAARKVSSINQ